MLKNIIIKLKRKRIMTQMLMWLNWSVTTINATFQFLDIYRYRYDTISTSNKANP